MKVDLTKNEIMALLNVIESELSWNKESRENKDLDTACAKLEQFE